MVLDPVSAFGLAGNVVQFIEFCANVVSESRKTYQSATEASLENTELETIATDLLQLSTRLQCPKSDEANPVIADEAFAKLLVQCNKVAAELLYAVELLKIKQGPHRRWKSFRQALISVWQKDRLFSLERRLASLREQITLHLVSSLSIRQQSILTNIDHLQKKTMSMNVDRDQKIDDISNAVTSIRLSHHLMPTKDDLDSINQSLQNSTLAATNISKEIEILQSLRYESMTVRHSKIVGAYSRTFNWIFNTDKLPLHDARAKIGFSKWLCSGGGIFWISGKAGSGKSTLMKYICDDARTATRLHQWAGDANLVTASYYFWNAGTDMQKSQHGLLQSLLYEILTKCPDLISTICQPRWDANSASSRFQRSEFWRPTELSAAFERLRGWASTSRKFCFFIDGLDEYDGDHFELIEIMTNIAQSPHIKLCLSSRPWNCFEDAFGKQVDCKLYLQDLTREDIEIYVKSKIARPMTWASAQKDGVRYKELALEIVERAQGVFLWVFLVVRSLQEGLANGDSILMLQKRLRALPTDLEPFFEHILRSVDQVYQEKLSCMFQVALQASGSLSLMTFSFLDEEDPGFALRLAPSPMTTVEFKSRQEDMRRRINGRSKGLLEVSAMQQEASFSTYSVEFLHRTVRDFLSTKDMRANLHSMTSSTYNACFALSRALLAVFKTIPEDEAVSQHRLHILDDVLHFAQRAEDQRGVADVVMLDDLERTSKARYQMFLESSSSYLKFTIDAGLVHYVGMKLDQQPRIMEYDKGSLLLAAIGRSLFRGKYEINLTKMVQMLLRRGLRPNQSILGRTVWQHFLMSFPPNDAESKEHAYWRGVLRLLLLGGADVQKSVALFDHMLDQNALFKSTATSSVELVLTVELLLSHGLDPNQPVTETRTIWTLFLERVSDPKSFFEEHILHGVVKAFLRYGADPLTTYLHHSEESTDIRRVYDMLTGYIVDSVVDMNEREAMKVLIKGERAYRESQEETVARLPMSHEPTIQSYELARKPRETRGTRTTRGRPHQYVACQ